MKHDNKHFRPWRAIARLTACSFVAAGLLVQSAHAGVYRWVDDKGQVHYGDTLPDTYQQRGAAELDKQGRVVGRTPSQAERAEAASREAETRARQRDELVQRRQDKALLSTYSSLDDIDDARDRELDRYRQLIENTESRARDVGTDVGRLKARGTIQAGQGKSLPPQVQSQIMQREVELEGLKKTILRYESEMRRVQERFAQDKVRFRELTEESASRR